MQGNSPLLVCAMRNSRDTVREGLGYTSYSTSDQPFRLTNKQSGALRAPPPPVQLCCFSVILKKYMSGN
jgi:hypothetical protein